MARKPKMINTITTKSTINMLPLIEGDTDYEVINRMMQLLYANEATLMKPQVGVHHGHIGSISKMMIYTTLMATSWNNPIDPEL